MDRNIYVLKDKRRRIVYKMVGISLLIIAIMCLLVAVIIVAAVHGGVGNIDFKYNSSTGMLKMEWNSSFKVLAKILYSFVPFSITEMNGYVLVDNRIALSKRCGINESYLIFAGNVIEPKYVPIMYDYLYDSSEDEINDIYGNRSLTCVIDTVNTRLWNKVDMPLVDFAVKNINIRFPIK